MGTLAEEFEQWLFLDSEEARVLGYWRDQTVTAGRGGAEIGVGVSGAVDSRALNSPQVQPQSS